jgi:hypothetical protein
VLCFILCGSECCMWRNIVEYGRKIAKYERNIAEYGRKIAKYGRNIAEYGRKIAKYGRKIAKYGRKIVEYERNVSEFDPTMIKVVRVMEGDEPWLGAYDDFYYDYSFFLWRLKLYCSSYVLMLYLILC